MRGYILSMLIWPVLMQIGSACPACNANAHAGLTAPVHAHGHGHAVNAAISTCPQCAASAAVNVYQPYPYGYRYCSPTNPHEFYAELYRRYYIELERMRLNARVNPPVVAPPGF